MQPDTLARLAGIDPERVFAVVPAGEARYVVIDVEGRKHLVTVDEGRARQEPGPDLPQERSSPARRRAAGRGSEGR